MNLGRIFNPFYKEPVPSDVEFSIHIQYNPLGVYTWEGAIVPHHKGKKPTTQQESALLSQVQLNPLADFKIVLKKRINRECRKYRYYWDKIKDGTTSESYKL